MIEKIQRHCFLSIVLMFPFSSYTVAPNIVVATITAGVNPAGIAVTPDNRYAYVANNNNYLLTGTSVSVLDLTTNTLSKNILDASFAQPYTVSINPAGTKAYITNSNGSTISIIDIASNTVIGTITGFDGPSGMAITADGTTAYVNNYGGPGGAGSGNATTVRVVNLNTNLITGSAITVGRAPAGLALTPNGNFLYVINYVDGNVGTGTVSVVQTSDNTVVRTITGFSGPFAIAITPDGTRAYVTNFGSNNFDPHGSTVSVIDLLSNTIIATINVGIQPAGIAITPDGKYAYVTNYNTLYANPGFNNLTAGEGTVNIIDIATNTVIAPIIVVGESPANLVVAPNGQHAYVTNYASNTVNVIALQSFTLAAQGRKIQNRFLLQNDIVNQLTWSATGTSLPVSYSIYRDAGLTDLVATISASDSLQFFDHNRIANATYTYYLVGTNSSGTTSTPLVIVVS